MTTDTTKTTTVVVHSDVDVHVVVEVMAVNLATEMNSKITSVTLNVEIQNVETMTPEIQTLAVVLAMIVNAVNLDHSVADVDSPSKSTQPKSSTRSTPR